MIHSNTKEHVEYVSIRVNVSCYGVNQVGGTGLGGAMDNGLNPTTTLGCASGAAIASARTSTTIT